MLGAQAAHCREPREREYQVSSNTTLSKPFSFALRQTCRRTARAPGFTKS